MSSHSTPSVIRFCAPFTVLLLLGTAGCPDDPVVPVTPYPDGGLDAGYYPPPPPPPVDAGYGPVAAQPCDGNIHLALQMAIKAREAQDLGRGMTAESNYSCQVVPEGGTLSIPVTLQPGHCYSFLGASYPNVSELDLVLKPNVGGANLAAMPFLTPFLAMAVLAQDGESGPLATVGKGSACFTNPFPFAGPAIIEAKARTGAGPIAVQVYSKRK